MKTNPSLCLFAILLACAGSPVAAQTPVRVTADNVNLRAKPSLENSEVLGQVHYDDRLVAFEMGEEWVEVAAPATIDLWISQDYVQIPDHIIGARRVNVRAGPSINYTVVDTLERGTPIESRGELSGWMKIAPPPTTHVWIHRDFVDLPADGAVSAARTESEEDLRAEIAIPPAHPVAPPPSGTRPAIPTPIVSPSVPARDSPGRVIPVPPPADLTLIPLEGQGRLAVFEGELRAAPLLGENPTRYRVVRWQNNRWQVLCHVYGKAGKFRSLQDKRVRVQGREYWVQGASAPVLVPDTIQEILAD